MRRLPSRPPNRFFLPFWQRQAGLFANRREGSYAALQTHFTLVIPMFRHLVRSVVASFVLLTLFTGPAAAQGLRLLVPATTLAPAGGALPVELKSNVLSVLPDDALGFVAAHHLRDTQRTYEAVLRKLKIPFDAGNDYAEITTFLDKLKGWDDQATHAVAFFAVPDETEPDVAVFVPVTNYKEFAKSLGTETVGDGISEFAQDDGPKGLIAEKSGYAVLVEKGDDQRALLERILASKRSLSGANEAVRRWIAAHQWSAVVLQSGLEKTLDEVLKGIDEVQETLKGGDVPENTAASVAATFDAYSSLLKAMRSEVTNLLIGSNLNEQTGLHLAAEALFKPDGRFVATTKSLAKLPADALNGLPNDGYFVAGAGTVPTEWMELLMNFSFRVYRGLPGADGKPAFTEEQIAKLEKASAQSMAGLKFFSASFNSAGEGIFGGAAALYKVADPDAFLKSYEDAVRQMSDLAKETKSPFLPQQVIDRKQIDGLEVLTLTTDVAKMLETMQKAQPVDMTQMLKTMFGNQGKLTVHVAKLDAETIGLTYDAAVLKQLAADVKAGKPSLGGNVKLQKTAALMPANPSWVGYLSVGGLIDFGKKVATAAMQAQGQGFFFPVPPFPEAAPIGVAGRISGPALEGHLVIPMDLMEATRDYVQQVMAMFGGGGR
jgi:hypothetical protein